MNLTQPFKAITIALIY